ncbi:MAG: hypothetical protein K2I58_04130, partial [Candidatus Amulumruptor sp.]|nr:hypothetical protein [Candidatus Amulumruptor sp.]
ALGMHGDTLYISSRRGIVQLDTRSGRQRQIVRNANPVKMVADSRGNLYYINFNSVYKVENPGTDHQTTITLTRKGYDVTFTSLAATDSCLYAGTLGNGIVALDTDGKGDKWYDTNN